MADDPRKGVDVATPNPIPDTPTIADVAAAIREQHLCLEEVREDVNQISIALAHARTSITNEALISRKFRDEIMANQALLLRALRIDQGDEAAKGAPQPAGKSLATMSQLGAYWRVVGAVGTAVIAAPIAWKMADAVFGAVAAVLTK